jgi:hypothetical protein
VSCRQDTTAPTELGIPNARIISSKVKETFGAFARDSQAGTFLARDKPDEGNILRLSEAQRNEVTSILKRHPTITESEFIAPGTLRI